MGVLHDGLYKSWSKKLLRDFSDDFQDEDDTNQDQKSNKKEISVNGPLNKIYPLILRNMIESSKSEKANFMKALSGNVIMPYKINCVHYMAYNNYSDSLQVSLI